MGRENKDVITGFYSVIKEALLQRLQLLTKTLPLRGSAAVKSGVADPVRIFVKQEPHKWVKILLGRFRLIASVSLLDSLIERALYQRRCKLEIRDWAEIPSKPGMGASDEHIQLLALSITRLMRETGVDMDTDVAGWDWQTKWWLMLAAVFVDLKIMDIPIDSDYGRAILARELAAMYPVLSDSEGVMYEVDEPIMASGRFVTSYRNSRMRTLASCIAGTTSMCMGDDCNEGPQVVTDAEVVESYTSMGYPPKIFEITRTHSLDSTVFCSLRFYERDDGTITAEPVRWIRSLYRLLSKKFTLIDLAQFEYEVRNSREYQANVALREALRVAAVAEVGSPQTIS